MKIRVIRVKTFIHEGEEVANKRRRPIDTLETTINTRLDLAGLPPHTFTDEALHLVLHLSEGVLRAVRNLYPGWHPPSRPCPLWNNPSNPTIIADSNYDESVEKTPNTYAGNLGKRHDHNPAINSDGASESTGFFSPNGAQDDSPGHRPGTRSPHRSKP